MNDKRIHIAIFGLKGFPAIGGTAAVGENIVKELNDRYNFTVYSTSSHCKERKLYDNVRMFIIFKFLPNKLNVFYYNLMSAIHAIVFGNYDLVHTNQIDTGYIVPLLRLRYKVIATHHGKTYQMSKWNNLMKLFFKATEKLMVYYANRVTFVAETERLDAQNKYGGRYLTINNGIDPYQTVKPIKVNEEYIMFAAGRIIPHKGCHLFLEALKKIEYKGKVLIAGDHDQLSGYRKQLEAYRDYLNIQFLGLLKSKDELLGYVQKAKLFVFPSLYEAMSMMLLEVAMVKTPLICSDIDENKFVFSNREVEFFESGNIEDLSSKITAFLCNPEALNIKARLAYDKVMSYYVSPIIANKYADLYLTFERLMRKARKDAQKQPVEMDAFSVEA